MSQVRLAGTGMTSFGSHPDRTGRDMFASAGIEALEDAGVPAADVDELFYGNFVGTLSERQGTRARSWRRPSNDRSVTPDRKRVCLERARGPRRRSGDRKRRRRCRRRRRNGADDEHGNSRCDRRAGQGGRRPLRGPVRRHLPGSVRADGASVLRRVRRYARGPRPHRS